MATARTVALGVASIVVASCALTEVGYDLPCRAGADVWTARVWVTPSPADSGVGAWMLFVDTVLWPVDGIVTTVQRWTRTLPVPNRVRGGVVGQLAGALLPCCSSYHVEVLSFATAALGVRHISERSLAGPCELHPADRSPEAAFAAVVDWLHARAEGLSRESIARRIASVDVIDRGSVVSPD